LVTEHLLGNERGGHFREKQKHSRTAKKAFKSQM
jgi:hypothetical protein